VSAEVLYTVQSEELNATTLFDQVIQENALVAVKPKLSPSATGDIQVLNQCLWSVSIEMNNGDVAYSPGKMVCVGPNQEVLEAVPVGQIAAFGVCTNSQCDNLDVSGNESVLMTLSEPLQFTLQPRNERK
jgi:hypothetical protein